MSQLTRENVKLGMLVRWGNFGMDYSIGIFGVITEIHEGQAFPEPYRLPNLSYLDSNCWSITVLDKSGERVIIDMNDAFVEIIQTDR